MAYEQKDMSGTLFVNDRKESDKHPDRTGTALIDGVSYWVSGWIKQGAKGPYMSMSFKRRDIQQQDQGSISQRAMPKARNDDMNDEIPF
jgi:hypothetical protein